MSDRTAVEGVSDKRTAILEATMDLISERGFHGTPMSMIAKTSGVSTGIIYHYFASKEELINELYLKIKTETIRAMMVGYSRDLSFRERFLRTWVNFVQDCLRHPKRIAFLEQFENSPYSKPPLPEACLNDLAPFLSFVQQGIQEGVFKNLPFQVLNDLTFGVAVSSAKQHLAGAIVLDDELVQAIANACWDAMKR